MLNLLKRALFTASVQHISIVYCYIKTLQDKNSLAQPTDLLFEGIF